MKIADIAALVSAECGSIPVTLLKENASSEDKLVQSKLIGKSSTDTRTYRVSFAKIRNYFPEFSCRHTIRDGISEMRDAFKRIELTSALFKNPNFYRLQTIERLLTEKRIGDDLRWRDT